MAETERAELTPLFATPIMQKQWPDTGRLNEGLKRIILEKRRTMDTQAGSNMGGWHSGPDLLKWNHPEIAQLNQYVHQAFGQMLEAQFGTPEFRCKLTVGCWANVNGDGDYNRIHAHGEAHWSGVYYVTIGNPDPDRTPNGGIELIDPRAAAPIGAAYGGAREVSVTVQPRPGLMLMFPSWLRHGVLPYFGDGERISIAFNLRMSDVQINRPAGLQGPTNSQGADARRKA